MTSCVAVESVANFAMPPYIVLLVVHDLLVALSIEQQNDNQIEGHTSLTVLFLKGGT